MSKHNYTPEQALRMLIEKLNFADAELSAQVLAAVNAGKDVQEIERTGRKRSRFYRHTVPYPPAEALQVAVDVLRAHFIEQPLFASSCHDNMAQAALGVGEARSSLQKDAVRSEDAGEEKAIEIELYTATQIIPAETASTHRQETLPMARVSMIELKEEQANLDRLRALVDFTEN